MKGLEVVNLTVKYPSGVVAVDGINLRVGPGHILALMGPSGCGKSSLLRAIVGLEPGASGDVLWDGISQISVPVHRRKFGIMFQDGQLFIHRNVGENIAFGLECLRPKPTREVISVRVNELLGMVGLDGYQDREVNTLSGGQAQRVALARALAPWPKLIALDEPLSALDADLRGTLVSELRNILKRTETAVIYVTHDRAEAEAVGDEVKFMESGRLID